MAHETIDRVTPKANRAEHEVRGAATKAADSAKLLQEHAVEAAEDNLRKLRSYAGSNPLITAGIAFAAGALLSAFDSPLRRRNDLLQTIAVVLIVLWLLGFVTSYTMGGFIHILLVVAVVMVLVRVVQGRRVL